MKPQSIIMTLIKIQFYVVELSSEKTEEQKEELVFKIFKNMLVVSSFIFENFQGEIHKDLEQALAKEFKGD